MAIFPTTSRTVHFGNCRERSSSPSRIMQIVISAVRVFFYDVPLSIFSFSNSMKFLDERWYAECTIAVRRTKRLWEPLPLSGSSLKFVWLKQLCLGCFRCPVFSQPSSIICEHSRFAKSVHCKMSKGPRTATRSWLLCTLIAHHDVHCQLIWEAVDIEMPSVVVTVDEAYDLMHDPEV